MTINRAADVRKKAGRVDAFIGSAPDGHRKGVIRGQEGTDHAHHHARLACQSGCHRRPDGAEPSRADQPGNLRAGRTGRFMSDCDNHLALREDKAA